MKRIPAVLFCTLLLVPAVSMARPYGHHRDRYYDDDRGGGGGFLDLTYVANETEKYTQDDPSGHTADQGTGDGFGIRGLAYANTGLALEGEYRSASHDFSTFSGDTDASRIGIGWVAPTTSGFFIEWNKLKFTDTTAGTPSTFSMDGWAIRGRLAGDVAPQVQIFGEAAYANLKDNFDTDWTGPEFFAGASVALSENLSLIADYRIRELRANDAPTATTFNERFNAVELGARFTFGR